MSKPFALGILIVGVILLVWGLDAKDSPASAVSEVVQGSPSDKSIFLIVGGALLSVVGGLALLVRRP
jgi:hypothetical protein